MIRRLFIVPIRRARAFVLALALPLLTTACASLLSPAPAQPVSAQPAAAPVAAPIYPQGAPVVYTDAPVANPAYSEAPIAANFPASNQGKLQATQHWMRIADDAGQSIVTMLKSPKVCAGDIEKCGLVAVKSPMVVTEFSRVFRNQLITRLVKLGVPVSKTEVGQLVVEFDVQPIQFSPNRPQYRYAGVPTELGAGVWAIRDVMSTEPRLGDAPPSTDALHWFRTEFAAGQTPRTELFITVSIANKTRFVARTSNAYYITDADKRLYDEELCFMFKVCANELKAAAAAKSADRPAEKKPPPTKSLELVGDCAKSRCLEGSNVSRTSGAAKTTGSSGQ